MRQRHNNPVSAVLTAIRENLGGGSKGREIPGPRSSDRLDGKTVMITGANSGLGKGVAVDLASRGARVLMACRSGIPEAGEEVRARSGNPEVEMLQVDLSDLASIDALADTLRDREERLDVLVCNAGVVPKEGRESAQGYELMVAVNFLAKTKLLDRLLRDGTIPNQTHDANARRRDDWTPRVVFVSSEAHRTADALDMDGMARFESFGIKDSMRYYGRSKLALSTYAEELARRLAGEAGGPPDVAVHHLCPGPVNSNMAREAPSWAKPILGPVMGALFNSPEKAALPVVYLACSPDLDGQTGVYLHMKQRKPPSDLALDPAHGTAVWEAAERMRGAADV